MGLVKKIDPKSKREYSYCEEKGVILTNGAIGRYIPRKVKREAFKKNNGKCVICNEKADSLDHIIPFSKGGRETIENMQPMCKKCNSKKGNKKEGLYEI